jgi:hypothetical protein
MEGNSVSSQLSTVLLSKLEICRTALLGRVFDYAAAGFPSRYSAARGAEARQTTRRDERFPARGTLLSNSSRSCAAKTKRRPVWLTLTA